MAVYIGQIEDISRLPWRRHKQLAQSIHDLERHTGESIRFPFLAFLMCYRWYLLVPAWVLFIALVSGPAYFIPPIFGIPAWFIGKKTLQWSWRKSALLTLGVVIASIPAAAILSLFLPIPILFLPHYYYSRQWFQHLQEETGTLAADPDAGLTENRVSMPGNPTDGYLLISEEVERVEFHGGTYLGILNTGPDELLDLAYRHWAFHWRHRDLLPVAWNGEEGIETDGAPDAPEEITE